MLAGVGIVVRDLRGEVIPISLGAEGFDHVVRGSGRSE
jgi:hypothetical protein